MAAVCARGEALRHVAPSLLRDRALILAAARLGSKSALTRMILGGVPQRIPQAPWMVLIRKSHG